MIDGEGKRGWVGKLIKEQEKFLKETDIYVHYFDFEDGVMGVHVFQNLSNCTLQICAIYFISVIP